MISSFFHFVGQLTVTLDMEFEADYDKDKTKVAELTEIQENDLKRVSEDIFNRTKEQLREHYEDLRV